MKEYLIPVAVKNVNNRLVKSGYPGMSMRGQQLAAQLARGNLLNDSLIQWYMASAGVNAQSGAVTQWLNLAPSRISLNKNLQQTTAANMPTWLRHSAREGHYGYLSGATTDYFVTPDAAPLRITGDFDIQVCLAMNDWTPTSSGTIINRWTAVGNQRSWQFLLSNTGTLSVQFTTDGTNGTAISATSSISVPFLDMQTGWVRVTRLTASSQAIFYTSTDGVNWTMLGAAQSLSNVAIFPGTSVLQVGAFPTGGSNIAGKVFRAKVYDGIQGSGGTLVFDFNPATYVSGTTFVDSSVNAATITLNGGAVVVTANCLYFDGTNDFLKTGPFTLAQPTTVYMVAKQLTWTVNDGLFDGNTHLSMALLQSATTPNLRTNAGSAATENSGLPVQTSGIITAIFNGTTGALAINRNASVTQNAGVASGNGFTLGNRGDLAASAGITVSEVLIFNTAHNAGQQAVVINYLNEKYSLGL